MKFSEVITIDKNDVHAKGQGQRSKVKVTDILNRFQTVTPVWINIQQQKWWGIGDMSYCFIQSSVKFQGHTEQYIANFYAIW